MKYLLLLLCGCVSANGITTQPKREKNVNGVIWFNVGRTLKETKTNNAKAREKAADICKPRFAMIEVDEFYDLASTDLLKGRTRMKINYECI